MLTEAETNRTDADPMEAGTREGFISISHWGMHDTRKPACTLNADIKEWLEGE